MPRKLEIYDPKHPEMTFYNEDKLCECAKELRKKRALKNSKPKVQRGSFYRITSSKPFMLAYGAFITIVALGIMAYQNGYFANSRLVKMLSGDEADKIISLTQKDSLEIPGIKSRCEMQKQGDSVFIEFTLYNESFEAEKIKDADVNIRLMQGDSVVQRGGMSFSENTSYPVGSSLPFNFVFSKKSALAAESLDIQYKIDKHSGRLVLDINKE